MATAIASSMSSTGITPRTGPNNSSWPSRDVRVDIGEEGGIHEVAVEPVRAAAAGGEGHAAHSRAVDFAGDPLGGLGRDHGTDLGRVVQRIADRERRDPLAQAFGDLGATRRSTIARLVAVHFWPVLIIAPLMHLRHRVVEIGIGEHDRRVLATELELDLRAAFAGHLA